MASSRIGFCWGEEKLTLVEFGKNSPLKVITAPLAPRGNVSQFTSNLSEEIQITGMVQSMMKDNRIASKSIYVSLSMKEIILRTFVIPFVKPEDVSNAVKFEARKYLPMDIQEVDFVFHVVPVTENKIKRLQIILFATRKETMARYHRIFKQVNTSVAYCEPWVVSLTKVLLFKKEINTQNHIAFLSLYKNSGSICFIDEGIPQFIREFSVAADFSDESSLIPVDALRAKIINEVENSLDFYARQFNREKIEQLLVSGEEIGDELFSSLEGELKIKLRKIAPAVTLGASGQSNDMDALCAMGACVAPSTTPLAEFNFIQQEVSKSKLETELVRAYKQYKEILVVLGLCVMALGGIFLLLQAQLKATQLQYNQMSSSLAAFANTSINDIQSQTQDSTDKLAAYKNIRTKSNMVLMVLKIASHLPRGAMLTGLKIEYLGDPGSEHISIDIDGTVSVDDPNVQIAMINQIFLDFKNDKELAALVPNVKLISLKRTDINNKPITSFTIHCY